ncbi:MAG: hypothetical protein QY323_01985 [Patescibacteria group bacterium]|nr:MAG: hypothetical protein QY323_01985 [Patescibacteria group bacterium]
MSKRAIILGFLALAAVATAVFFLREPDPQAVLRQAAKNLLAEKTFHVDLSATVVGVPKELESGVVANATGVDIAVRMDVDRTDPMRQASVSMFELSQGLTSGGQAKLVGEARRKDGVHYLKLQTMEGVQGVDADRIVGVWMKAGRPFVDLLLASGSPEPALDAAEFEMMKKSLQTVDLFTVVETLPKETVAGAKSFHYAVEMNMEVVSALMLKRRELSLGRELTSEDVLVVTGELMQWNRPVGEIWVDAKTRKFKQLTLGTSLGLDGKSGAAAGTLVFSDEGKPVRVDAPEAEDVEKVLGPLFEKRLSLAGDRERDRSSSAPETSTSPLALLPGAQVQSTDTDHDGLVDAQEAFYGADAWNPDTDGDGYADGLEVEKGMNPVGPGPLFGFGL